MGEWYLQRKLFGRMKRTRTQTSISSSTNTQATSASTSVGLQPHRPAASSRQCPSVASSGGCGRPNSSAASLNMLRNNSEGANEDGLDDGVGGEDEDLEDYDAQSSLKGVALATTTPTGQRGTTVPKKKARSRMASAGRAIFFFRRAASALASSGSGGGGGSGSPGAELSRQNTGDSGVSEPAPPALPQFIVPKVSALRLPLVCLVKSLEGELMCEVFVHRYELGQYLIESLKVSLGLNDCKYFGLKMAKSVDDQEDLRNLWLDLNESVCKQIKQFGKQLASSNSSSGSSSAAAAATTTTTNNNNSGATAATFTSSTATSSSSSARSIDFYLRIKFYPPNVGRVQDPFLRHYLWLQLKRDLRLGKLTSSMNNLTLLMACVLQHELGDFRPELAERVPELNILPNQDLIEEQAVEVWRSRLAGLKRHQAQMQFLRAAVILETYGFDYYPVRDHQRQRAYLLGFNYAGIKSIRNGRIVHHFRWHSISKISYERRMIIFHIEPAENSKRKQILGFKCLSNDDCQSLYMRLLEQKYFFTVDLAYFDKSVRRPSCLYGQETSTSSNDWGSGRANGDSRNGDTDSEFIQQQQQHSPPNTMLGGNHDHNQSTAVATASRANSPVGQQSTSSSCREQMCPSCTTNGHSFLPMAADLTTTTTRCASGNGGCYCARGDGATSFGEAVAAAAAATELPSDLKPAGDPTAVPVRSSLGRLGSPRLQRQQSTARYSYGGAAVCVAGATGCITGDGDAMCGHEADCEDEAMEARSGGGGRRVAGSQLITDERLSFGGDDERRGPTTGDASRLLWWWPKLLAHMPTSERLMQFAETILVQPPLPPPMMMTTTTTTTTIGQEEHSQPTLDEPRRATSRVLMPALRFCLAILVMNFLLRMTESFSNVLVELLTVSQTSTVAPTAAEHSGAGSAAASSSSSLT